MVDGIGVRGASGETGAWYHVVVCLACGVLLLALLLLPTEVPARFKAEHWAADWRAAYLSSRLPTTHPHLVIVSVTEKDVERFPYFLPINRGYIAELVNAVNEAGAVAIGLDFYFTRDTEPGADAQFEKALKRAKDKVVLGVYESDSRQEKLDYQRDLVEKTGVRAGYIDLAPDEDHVVRYRSKALPGAVYQTSFSSALAGRFLSGNRKSEASRIAWLLPPADEKATFLKMTPQRLLSLSPEKRAALLNGRVVMIGGTMYSLDRHWTPLSRRTDEPMYGVEIHAHMAAEVVDGNRSYSELTPHQMRILVGVLAVVGIFLGSRFRMRNLDFLDWRVASFVVVGIDLGLFKFFHVVLPFTLAAVTWIAAVTTGTQLRNAIAWSFARLRG